MYRVMVVDLSDEDIPQPPLLAAAALLCRGPKLTDSSSAAVVLEFAGDKFCRANAEEGVRIGHSSQQLKPRACGVLFLANRDL